ncbi:MAG: D-alanyl-D-alanine carboxypeptidase/D-alanyl-D-alanine-endopeptidase [Acidobacteriota bacterium]
MRQRVFALALVLALAAGCTRRPAPDLVPALPAEPRPGLGALRVDLAACFAPARFANAVWGVSVRSLATGEVLFERNPRTLLMPASNMKVITAAVAAERLGWTHTFETRLVAAGPIEQGTLMGDLIVEGTGDPSFAGRPGERTSVVDAWAEQLLAAGLTTVEGRIVGDDNALGDEGLGQGWAWDYLAYGYATPAGGLAFNENVVLLTLRPGPRPGDPAVLVLTPDVGGIAVDHRVTTGDNDSRVSLNLRRMPGSGILRVTGSIPANRQEVRQTVSVDNPTLFLAEALRRALVSRGVDVAGGAADIDTLPAPPRPADAGHPASPVSARAGSTVLLTHVSPPLADIIKVMLKVSQNMYADTLLRVIGTTADGDRLPAGTADAGQAVVEDTLNTWGIEPRRYVLADGSGLSRYNYLSTDVLVDVLTRMYADERHRQAFLEALPIAGVDGTIAGRMKGTRAEGNARAKTGSIAHARALSGFVTTAEGEPVVFSMMVNNFNVPQSEADAVIDRAVARLANFRRH